MRDPLVSVVLPVWNPCADLLREALESVLAQTLAEFELIVVEDPGETSAEGVLALLADPRIRYVRNPARKSMAAARNQGIDLARAELIAMFDGDDVCERRRLERQVACFAGDSVIDVLGCRLRVIDEHGAAVGERAYPTDHDRILQCMRAYNPLAHPTVMFRKRVVVEAGGYSARPDCVCDDYDLWSRLARAGARFHNLDEALVRYRLHPGQTKNRRLKATLRDTLRIKNEYWKDLFGIGDHARMWGERLLLLLPSSWIMALFVRRLIPNE